MVEIKNIKVYDLYESWIASGYPMRSEFDNVSDLVKNMEIWCYNKGFLPSIVEYLNNQDDKDLTFKINLDNTCTITNKLTNKVAVVDCIWLPTLFRGGSPNVSDEFMDKYLCEGDDLLADHSTHVIGLLDAIKAYKRSINLHKASASSNVKCHDNWITGVRVSFDMKYPGYFSPELQRYHWVDFVSSSSKMHMLAKIKMDKCCNKYVSEDVIKLAQSYIDAFNENPTYENRMKMISNCPLGLELYVRVSTNFKQLQTIYYQRHDHRLKEDWGAICKMIEDLPFSKQLIIGESK